MADEGTRRRRRLAGASTVARYLKAAKAAGAAVAAIEIRPDGTVSMTMTTMGQTLTADDALEGWLAGRR